MAFRTAMEGKRGPVHLTIPHDLQEQTWKIQLIEVFQRYEKSVIDDMNNWLTYPNLNQIEKSLDMLSNAKKPVIKAGIDGYTESSKDLDIF